MVFAMVQVSVMPAQKVVVPIFGLWFLGIPIVSSPDNLTLRSTPSTENPALQKSLHSDQAQNRVTSL